MHLKQWNKPLTIILLSALIAPSYANNALTNLYLSAEGGWSAMAHGRVSPYQFNGKKNLGYRLAIGYSFSLADKIELGPELGYGHYGKISYADPSNLIAYYESRGWSALANLNYHLSPKVDLALKGGVTEVSQHYDIAGPNVTPGGFYQQAFRPTLVLSSSYSLSTHTSIGLSYTHIFANTAPLSSDPNFTFTNVNQICSVNAVMAVVTYRI